MRNARFYSVSMIYFCFASYVPPLRQASYVLNCCGGFYVICRNFSVDNSANICLALMIDIYYQIPTIKLPSQSIPSRKASGFEPVREICVA